MIEFLNEFISVQSLIWLFLAAFMLHDFEEIIRIEPWFRKHAEQVMLKIPERFQSDFRSLSSMTSSQFAVAVCLEFIVFIPVTFMAAEKGSYMLFMGFNVILLLHVFMHIGQALYVRKLVPGVVTAVLITLPYSVYVLYRLLQEQLIDWHGLLLSAPLGLLLVPIVWLGHKVGERLLRSKQKL